MNNTADASSREMVGRDTYIIRGPTRAVKGPNWLLDRSRSVSRFDIEVMRSSI